MAYIENSMGERTHPEAPEFSATPSVMYPIHTNTLQSISEKIPDPQYKVWVDVQISLFSSTYGSVVLNAVEKSTKKILKHDLALSK